VSSEGCYYTIQMAQARKQGRILRIPIAGVPVNTFWDIGNSDGCGIWFHQLVGMEDRFIGYYEAHGEDLTHYMRYLQNTGYLWNKHFLPHDAAHAKLSEKNKSVQRQLEGLGLANIVIVPVTPSVGAGIQLTRQHMATAYWDEAGCKEGLQRLTGYKKKWNATAGRWADEPLHDANSEGADSFRQWAQAKAAGLVTLRTSARAMPTMQAYQSSGSGMGLLG
jgi:hypothetical protein